MSTTPSGLLRDPIFQLNTLLWLAQPLPEDSWVEPIFYRQGFHVYAIAPLLTLPPEARLSLSNVDPPIDCHDAARPDVVLVDGKGMRFSLMECKASSFNISSSTAAQGRTLFMNTGSTLVESLGLAGGKAVESFVAFILPESNREMMDLTIAQIRGELTLARITPSDGTALGLEASDSTLSLVTDTEASAFFRLKEGVHASAEVSELTDPRPLYFIPYDPDCDQTTEERAFAKRVLFERMQGSVIAAVGHLAPPFTLAIKTEKVLNDALFGVYDLWDNHESAKHMRKLCKSLMSALARAVQDTVPGAFVLKSDQGWVVTVTDDAHHEAVLRALTAFRIETMDIPREPEADLFDEVTTDI